MKPSAFQINERCSVYRFENENESNSYQYDDLSLEAVQFHFVLKGHAQFWYNNRSYQLEAQEDQMLLLFNTQKALPIDLELGAGGAVLSIVIDLEQLHTWFSEESKVIPFFNGNAAEKKYYSQDEIRPAMAIPLNQLMYYSLHASVQRLYFKAKALEIMALFFNRVDDADLEKCPYLADDENMRKIRKAKDLLIASMAEPPSLEALAEQVDLPIGRLKEGFKEVYGDSVFAFLLDYKLDYARKLLLTNTYSVADVGARVGYSTASHFIAAFKKKFGTTPKKYLADFKR